jgi:hypothetical protein
MKIRYPLIILISVVIIISSLTVWSYVDWLNATDYWGLAPNGEYLVFVSGKIENEKIFFPLCEHSAGDLHGYWNIASNVSIPDSIKNSEFPYGYALATLQNNVIVNLEATEP